MPPPANIRTPLRGVVVGEWGAAACGRDADGRLREVRAKYDDHLLARYTYDALKRRVSRTVWSADSASSATVLYVWDGDHVVEERLADGANSGLGTLVAEYVWGAPTPNGLLAQRRTASHPDYSTTLGVGTGHSFSHVFSCCFTIIADKMTSPLVVRKPASTSAANNPKSLNSPG